MDVELTYCCPECDYKVNQAAGTGLIYWPGFEVVDKDDKYTNMWVRYIESEELLDEVEVIVNQKGGRINLDNFGYRIYYSETCKELSLHFYFELFYEDEGKQLYIPEYFDKHKKELVIVSEEEVILLDLECPKCKTKIRSVSITPILCD